MWLGEVRAKKLPGNTSSVDSKAVVGSSQACDSRIVRRDWTGMHPGYPHSFARLSK